MRTKRSRMLWAGMFAVALVGWLDVPARAQQQRSRSYVPNTYADFPYNQGSLFYQYRGANAATRRAAPRRQRRFFQPAYQPRTYSYPYQYPRAPNTPAPTYYYYPAVPR